MMRKVLVFMLIGGIIMFSVSPVLAGIYFNHLREQVEMTLAEEDPRFPSAIVSDFLFLAIQNAAAHGLACQEYNVKTCSTASQDYMFTDALDATYPKQGLFIRAMDKDQADINHRSIWEIHAKDLGRKELINPPAYQYYYIWHSPDTSWFRFFDNPASKDTVSYIYYFVPLGFAGSYGGYVYIPSYFEEIVIEYCLYFCYRRIKAYDLMTQSFNAYAKNLSAIRKIHIGQPPEVMFNPKEIKP